MSTTTKEAIARFLMKHWGTPNGWNPDHARAWLDWYIAQPTAVITIHRHRTIIALLLCRPVTTVVHAQDWYHCDPHADVIFCDAAIATEPGQLATLFRAMTELGIWGQWLAYERRGHLRFWPFDRAETAILTPKGTHHGKQ